MEKTRNTRHHRVVTGVYVSLVVTLLFMAIAFLMQRDFWGLLKFCLLSLVLISPKIVEKVFRVTFTQPMEVYAVAFIFASCILGEVYGFYLKYPLWDDVLHFGGGLLFCAFACAFASGKMQAKFAFCFSVTTSTLWEFFEFFADLILKTNMQKDTLVGGQLDIGLIDTMTDMVAGALGAAFFVVWLASDRREARHRAEKLIPIR